MKRPRPYIPLSVRVAVVRHMLDRAKSPYLWSFNNGHRNASEKISFGLFCLGLSGAQLDHDPALILRKYKVDRRKPEAAWFTPNANDPAHLIYRPVREHLEKSVGRKADAEKTVTTKGSDSWLKTKFRRLEQPRKKPAAKIAARAKPWPKRGFARRAPR